MLMHVFLNQSSDRLAFLWLEIQMSLELNKADYVLRNLLNAGCLYELSADLLLFFYIKFFVTTE